MAFKWFKNLWKKAPEVVLEEETFIEQPKDLIRKAILVNNSLTIVLTNGDVLQRTDANRAVLEEIEKAGSYEQIRKIMLPTVLGEEDVKTEKLRDRISGADSLKKHKDFEYKDGALYVKNVSLSLPPLMVDAFLEVLEQEKNYKALLNFWYWLSLNPNPESIQDAYTFVEKNDIKLTPHGLMVLYRRIVPVNKTKQDKQELEAITHWYSKVKVNWKKNTENYIFYRSTSNEYKVIKKDQQKSLTDASIIIGNLKELYLKIKDDEANTYTDAHTHKQRIKIGDIYSIPEDQIDVSNSIDCGRGLHVASKSFNYGGFGNTAVMVLVNPMKIRAVPSYNTGKMRVQEMYIAAALQDGKYTDDEEDLVEFDNEYFAIGADQLKELAKSADTKELKKYSFLPSISTDTVKFISNQMENARKQIKDRIVKV